MGNKGKSNERVYMDVHDVCELYDVCERTVYRWARSGKLEGKKAGQKWLFTPEAVKALLR